MPFFVGFTALFCFSLLILCMRYNLVLHLGYIILCGIPGILDTLEDCMMLFMVRNNGMSNMAYQILNIIEYTKWILVVLYIVRALWVLSIEIRGKNS